jgi:hypothetical protein
MNSRRTLGVFGIFIFVDLAKVVNSMKRGVGNIAQTSSIRIPGLVKRKYWEISDIVQPVEVGAGLLQSCLGATRSLNTRKVPFPCAKLSLAHGRIVCGGISFYSFSFLVAQMEAFGAGAGYTDANRAFLQAFLARSVLTLDTARPIIAACSSFQERREMLPHDVTVEDLNDYIADANRRLSPLDLEIRSTFHQQTRERIYALVNTTSDALTQLATTYTPDEIAFVKNLLDAMFDGQNNKGKREAMCISGIDAIQVGRAQNRRQTVDGDENATQSTAGVLSGKDVETVLRKLVDEGWLDKSRAGFYSLSPRALMELKGWLVDTYNDEDEDGIKREKVKFCHACKEIITVVRPDICQCAVRFVMS